MTATLNSIAKTNKKFRLLYDSEGRDDQNMLVVLREFIASIHLVHLHKLDPEAQ